jgi:hypothetical protein
MLHGLKLTTAVTLGVQLIRNVTALLFSQIVLLRHCKASSCVLDISKERRSR